MYHFDKLVDRKGTDCIKWDECKTVFGTEEVLPLWIADMDFEVLPELQKAMVERASHPTYGYTFASEAYYQNIISWNQKRNCLTIEKEDILPVPGVVCAVSFAIYALTQPGDKILVNTPVYNPFFDVITSSDRSLVTSSLTMCNGKHCFDLADMEDKMKQGVKMLILCNPHNPVGRVWTKEELEPVVSLCEKYQVALFSDEIHSDITYGGHHHTSLFTVSSKAQEIGIVAMAPSKTFNIAGLKSSMLIIKNPAIRAKVKKWMDSFHIGVDLFAYKATEIVYGYGETWCDELNAYLFENAKYVVDFVTKNLPKVKAYVPEGTYLMWLDFSAYGLSQEDLMNRMKHNAKVGVNNGSAYGQEGNGFIRLNIGCPRSVLEQALKQIQSAF